MAMALTANYEWPDGPVAGFTFGYGDARQNEFKVNDVYGAITLQHLLRTANTKMRISIDSRLAQERFESDTLRFSPRTQQSLSITSLLNFGNHWSYAAGAHYGTSDRLHPADTKKIETQKGWQVDLGLVDQSRPQIQLGGFLAIESRVSDLEGDSNGFKGPQDSTSYLMRFAFELTYLLNQP